MKLEKNNSKFRVVIVQNDVHLQFRKINCLKSKYCRNTFKLSTKFFENTSMMFQTFKTTFRDIYVKNYNVFVIFFHIDLKNLVLIVYKCHTLCISISLSYNDVKK